MTQYYLHFGMGEEPRQTVPVEHKETAPPRKGATQSGYGAALPTRHMVKWAGRWRRVKVACYGNSGSSYIGKPGAWIATVDRDF